MAESLIEYIVSNKILLTYSNLQQIIDIYKKELLTNAINSMFPVGCIWVTSKAPDNGGDPNILYPGTYWKRIKGCSIWAADNADTVDDVKRGRNEVSTADLPYHTHKSGGDTAIMLDAATAHVVSIETGIKNIGIYGYTGTFTCSKNSSGSWENSGIVTGREQTGSGSYGWSGTAYQTSRYTLNIQHKHTVPDTAGNIINPQAVQSVQVAQSKTTMDITNVHICRYFWERTA